MIEVLFGPIASFKSTYARARAEQGAIIIDHDNTVMNLHGGNYKLYEKGLKPLYKTTEMVSLCMALVLGRDVVIDRTNKTPNARRRYIGIGHAFDTQVLAIVFPNEGPEIHARRRADADGRGYDYAYWLDVATRHQAQFIPPTRSEGFDIVLPYQIGMQVATLQHLQGAPTNVIAEA
jgi:predicted kinase